jgi:hypothetical protein
MFVNRLKQIIAVVAAVATSAMMHEEDWHGLPIATRARAEQHEWPIRKSRVYKSNFVRSRAVNQAQQVVHLLTRNPTISKVDWNDRATLSKSSQTRAIVLLPCTRNFLLLSPNARHLVLEPVDRTRL